MALNKSGGCTKEIYAAKRDEYLQLVEEDEIDDGGLSVFEDFSVETTPCYASTAGYTNQLMKGMFSGRKFKSVNLIILTLALTQLGKND